MSRSIILACLAVILVQQQKPKDKTLGNQGQKDAQSAQDQRDASTTYRTAPNAPDQKTGGDENNGQNQAVNVTVAPEISVDKATDWIIALCTIVLTAVGIIGTRAAIQTLKQIKRQADTLEDHKIKFDDLAKAATNNAIAAKDSADALVAGQRAWVMVDIEFNPSGVGTTTGHDIPDSYGIQIRMNYRNDGQTPAWITERRATLIPISDNLIPQHPDLSRAQIIAQGTISLAMGRRHGYGHVDTPLECAIDDSTDAIYLVYGVVRYRTAFKGTGETTFGYRVTRGWDRLERLENWPEWNKNV